MGVFDEDLVIESMDKEVVARTNRVNYDYTRALAGVGLRNHVHAYSIDKRGKMKLCNAYFDKSITLRAVSDYRTSVTFNLKASCISRFTDKSSGLDIYKIMDPILPVIIEQPFNVPDCFMLDVPKGTKEVTIISILSRPLEKLPKIKGNVKVTYINRVPNVKLRKGEKISITKWWDGYYENR